MKLLTLTAVATVLVVGYTIGSALVAGLTAVLP